MHIKKSKVNDRIVINDNISIYIVASRPNKVLLGVEAPTEVHVFSGKVYGANRQQKGIEEAASIRSSRRMRCRSKSRHTNALPSWNTKARIPL